MVEQGMGRIVIGQTLLTGIKHVKLWRGMNAHILKRQSKKKTLITEFFIAT